MSSRENCQFHRSPSPKRLGRFPVDWDNGGDQFCWPSLSFFPNPIPSSSFALKGIQCFVSELSSRSKTRDWLLSSTHSQRICAYKWPLWIEKCLSCSSITSCLIIDGSIHDIIGRMWRLIPILRNIPSYTTHFSLKPHRIWYSQYAQTPSGDGYKVLQAFIRSFIPLFMKGVFLWSTGKTHLDVPELPREEQNLNQGERHRDETKHEIRNGQVHNKDITSSPHGGISSHHIDHHQISNGAHTDHESVE